MVAYAVIAVAQWWN